jgi:endonuclease-8
MPEGDSIHKLAARMGPLLVGRSLRRVTTQGLEREALAGQEVTAVRAVGKHLLINTGDGTELRTHLGMNGRWRRYPPGTDPPMSPGRASLVLATDHDVLVCINARTVEIAGRRAPMRGAAVAALGPDVLGRDFDPRDAAARARAQPRRPIGEILLDQGVAAGIGNVYRCEVLFLERLDPTATVAALDDEQLVAAYRRARELMGQNLGPGPRVTAPATHATTTRTWVYGRTGLPCLVCGSAILTDVDRDLRRLYWCPRCQALPPAGAREP